MKIENGSLIAKVGTKNVTVPLPAVQSDAKVKAWIVPKDYQSNGLFVAVTVAGQIEEVPACDMAVTEYLGELTLDAGDAEKLEAAKAIKLDEINTACNAAVAALASSYPEREVQSWPQQVKEAEAISASPTAQTPLLSAIAAARGLPVAELATRVLAKMTAYAAISGALIGRRQAAEDAIGQATTIDGLSSVVW